MFKFLEELHLRHEVTVCVLTDQFEADAAGISLSHAFSREFHLYKTNPYAGDEFMPARMATHQSLEFLELIAQITRTGNYDVIHCESYFLMSFVPATCSTPVVLVEENIEYELEPHLNRRKTGLSDHEQSMSRQSVLDAWTRASEVAFFTQRDVDRAQTDSDHDALSLLTIGWDHLGADQHGTVDRVKEVVFVGNYTWPPTAEAANWLVRDIWPRVLTHHPEANLSIVGSGLNEEQTSAWRNPGVCLVGPVENVSDWLHDGTVVVAPMLIAGGISIKVIEALSRNCTVVTTDNVVRCFPPKWGTLMKTANTTDEFVQQIDFALRTFGQSPSRPELPTWKDAQDQLEDLWLVAAKGGSRGLR